MALGESQGQIILSIHIFLKVNLKIKLTKIPKIEWYRHF